MVTFEEVTKSFQEDFWKKPKIVLNKFSFSLRPGSITGFLGANGAGKTTSIKAMLGFISLDNGTISYNKELGADFKEVRSQIGYFPESPYFYPYLTGRDFCNYLGRLQGISTLQIKENMKKWGEALNIAYALDKRIRSYSKGMLQRLGFLSTLIHDPSLVILDEPLSGLDPVGRKEFKDVLLSLNSEGRTIFFSSHIVTDVEEICQDVVVIEEGALFYSGKTQHLLEKSNKSQYVATVRKVNREEINTLSFIKAANEVDKNIIRFNFNYQDHNKFMTWLKQSDVDLLELRNENPSLEEVIYNSSLR